MIPEFRKGFLIYRKGDSNLVFAVPHSGPALGATPDRDDNAETVASICLENMGGKLVISNVPRKRSWGIDFNRDIPDIGLALKAYNEFEKREEKRDNEYIYNFRTKYAWVAKDETDYYNRLSVYQNFWAEVGEGERIILVHRIFNRIKAVPSIMDVIIFSEKEIKKKLLDDVVEKINTKYFDFFSKVEKDYRQAIFFEMKRVVLNLLRIHDGFDLKRFGIGYKKLLDKDIEKIMRYADLVAANRLKRSFTPQNFLDAVNNALQNVPTPRITIANVHDGNKALGPKNKLFPYKNRTIIQAESSNFLNFWHPKIAAKIIQDIIEEF